MSELTYNKLLLVYDETNNGIICQVNSETIGNALTLGMINGTIAAFPLHFFPQLPMYQKNFNNMEEHYQLTNKHDIVPMPEKFITPEWRDYRKFLLQKNWHLGWWEFRVRRQLARVNDFFGNSDLAPFLLDQLNKCNPEEGYYTQAINEWAHIQDVSPSIAYSELKLKHEGRGLAFLRVHAIYEKYTRIITTSKNIDELKKNFNDAFEALMGSANL